MEKTLITYSVPNFITIGLVGLGWLCIFALGGWCWNTYGPGAASGSTANNSGGY